jgi:hypothetical protein
MSLMAWLEAGFRRAFAGSGILKVDGARVALLQSVTFGAKVEVYEHLLGPQGGQVEARVPRVLGCVLKANQINVLGGVSLFVLSAGSTSGGLLADHEVEFEAFSGWSVLFPSANIIPLGEVKPNGGWAACNLEIRDSRQQLPIISGGVEGQVGYPSPDMEFLEEAFSSSFAGKGIIKVDGNPIAILQDVVYTGRITFYEHVLGAAGGLVEARVITQMGASLQASYCDVIDNVAMYALNENCDIGGSTGVLPVHAVDFCTYSGLVFSFSQANVMPSSDVRAGGGWAVASIEVASVKRTLPVLQYGPPLTFSFDGAPGITIGSGPIGTGPLG